MQSWSWGQPGRWGCHQSVRGGEAESPGGDAKQMSRSRAGFWGCWSSWELGREGLNQLCMGPG